MPDHPASSIAVDKAASVDEGRWTIRNGATVGLCALALLVEGFDGTLTSLAAPAMAKAWSTPRTDFATAFAAGSLGMAIGTILGGLLGDRIGRKPALLACALTFAVMTLAILPMHSVGALAVLRFIGGLGMGGALPNVTALASESTPVRGRSIALTIVALGATGGGLLCALVAAGLLDKSGWQVLFVIGGGASLVLALILLLFVRESPAFLAESQGRRARLANRLGRTDLHGPNDLVFSSTNGGKATGSLFMRLFAADLRGSTLALWVGAFVFIMGLGSVITWGPSLLVSLGYTPSMASLGLSAYQAGCTLGVISAGAALNRWGSRRTLWTSMLTTAAWLAVPAAIPVLTLSLATMIAYLGIAGFLLLTSSTLVFLTSAFVYPPTVRATGVGAATAVGRAGGILSSYTGAAVLKAAGPPLFFGLLAILSVLAATALPLLKRHVSRDDAKQSTKP